MPVNLICSDVRLSEMDWIEPVAGWHLPPGKDHGPQLAELYNKPMTRILADVAGCIDHGPIDVPRCSFTLQGTCGGPTIGLGGTMFRPIKPDQPYMLAIDDSPYSAAVAVTIRDCVFKIPTRDFESRGDCLRIHRGQNPAIENVQIDGFDRGLVVDVRGHFYGLSVNRLTLRKCRVGVLVDSDEQRTSAAALLLRQVIASQGEIGIWIRRGFYTAAIEGGIVESFSQAGVLIDAGRVAMTATYLENGRDADGRHPPALAVRGRAQVSLRATSDNGRYWETGGGAMIFDDGSALFGRKDGTNHPNTESSYAPVYVRTSELPRGFPQIKAT